MSVIAGHPNPLTAQAAGADAYVELGVLPGNIHTMMVLLDPGNGAVISTDGGVTDNIEVVQNSAYILDGLDIGKGQSIQAKNLTPGSNYTNLRVFVW